MPDENDVWVATILPYADFAYNDRDKIFMYIGITIARIIDSILFVALVLHKKC